MGDSAKIELSAYQDDLDQLDLLRWTGEVTDMVGLMIESRGPAVAVGDFCDVQTSTRTLRAQVIGFRDGRVLSMPLEDASGLQPGDRVVARSEAALVPVGENLLGRVLNGFARPMDDGGPITAKEHYRLYAAPPSPLEREHIVEPLITGIRAIDALLPCGKGQRIGLFGGSGVGKSTLLSTISRNHSADVNVVALIGERNREVRAFLDHDLGAEGLKRSVMIVSTSDQPAPLRVRACFVALAVAEYFRDQGADVLLVMDSVTRLAMAQREIGLTAGEPPSQKGYPPSVFGLMPKIFERAGNFKKGSITGFFTVLVDGDDLNEPIADNVRSILDGHIVLSRQLQAADHYPAIDILNSVSRLAPRLASPEHSAHARKIREALATYARSEDLIQLGAHVQGVNPKLDASIRCRDRILGFLRQNADEYSTAEQTRKSLGTLAEELP